MLNILFPLDNSTTNNNSYNCYDSVKSIKMSVKLEKVNFS